ISLQCSCNWNVQVNKGKDQNGNITWQELRNSTRQKRTWVAPPLSVIEQQDNRYRNPIAKVHSDLEVKKGKIIYRITGQGVDKPPFNVFIMDPKTGYLNVTNAIIDREQTPVLYITAHAVTLSGQEVESPLQLTVKIQDINDNAPIFSQMVFAGSVEERSQANTLVMVINAFDADEQNTINSQIAYKILSQNPSNPPMFIINQYSGEVYTISNFIDREAYSSYSLMVSGSDLNGAAGGLSGQCGSDITILDVNDNFPELEFDSYSVNIMENMVGLTDLRMKVFDADEMYTDNWNAMFEIVSGNEGGWFVIDTDYQTNEGVLRVVKSLDYESMKMANLAIIVTNRAAFHYSVMSEYQAKMTNINVQVQNQIEPPAFVPNTIQLNIPPNLSPAELLNYVIGKATAINQETGQAATNVVYMLDNTSSKYFVIDSTTGEIKMTYEMTRGNGPETINGSYNGIVYAETEDGLIRTTATATVIANISSPNPIVTASCPVITKEPRVICLDSKRTIINAYQEPSNPPFMITMLPDADWYLEPLNATAVTLVGRPSVSPRNYSLVFNVADSNNLSCPNPFQVTIPACECTPSGSCDASKTASKSASLGPAAIGLMVLGFLALLLALLLLPLCLCGAAAGQKFVPVAAGYEGACHQWGTEGAKPEDVDMTSMLISSPGAGSEVHTMNYAGPLREEAMLTRSVDGGISAMGEGGRGGAGGAGRAISTTGFETNTYGNGAMRYTDREFNDSVMGTLPPSYKEGGTLNMAYVENYFADKAEAFANEDEGRPSNDCLLIYDNEGVGSPAGSVGCCSFIADDLDDAFLDTLGPKFKTLAEICIGSEIDMPGGNQPRSFPSVPIIETDFVVDEPTLNVHSNRSVPVNSSAFVTESSFPPTNFQPAMSVPEPVNSGNVFVTETYTTTGSPMRSVVRSVEPSMPASYLVTERVVGSTSTPRAVFTNVPNSSNVIVTERVLRPTSGVHEFIELPNLQSLPDSSNVVVTERVVDSGTARQSKAFTFPDMSDSQNVVVTERVIQPLTTERVLQPISNVQGGLSIRPDMGSSQNIYVTEKTVRAGPATTTHMLSAEPVLMQSVGSTSPSLTRSSVRTYSTVQYTKK
ncbi:PREDICTED: desmoglein-1-like, partial [Nanorana parkeri]|uniref:desmoglein-1-like n=1 Tax=Nanorana parkeri TaxID=125878 RepID=UPI000854BCA1